MGYYEGTDEWDAADIFEEEDWGEEESVDAGPDKTKPEPKVERQLERGPPQELDGAPSSAAVDGAEAPAEKEEADEELRIDPESGEAFTKAEFIEYYEGTDEWDAADVFEDGSVDAVEEEDA